MTSISLSPIATFRSCQIVVDLPDEELGGVTMHSVVPRLSATPRCAAPTRAYESGEHTAENLARVERRCGRPGPLALPKGSFDVRAPFQICRVGVRCYLSRLPARSSSLLRVGVAPTPSSLSLAKTSVPESDKQRGRALVAAAAQEGEQGRRRSAGARRSALAALPSAISKRSCSARCCGSGVPQGRARWSALPGHRTRCSARWSASAALSQGTPSWSR